MEELKQKIKEEKERIGRMADKEKNDLNRSTYLGMYVAYNNVLMLIDKTAANTAIQTAVSDT